MISNYIYSMDLLLLFPQCSTVRQCSNAKNSQGAKAAHKEEKTGHASSHIGGETCEAMQIAHTLKSCQIHTNLRNELTLYVFHN